jgi:hypothetical protein
MLLDCTHKAVFTIQLLLRSVEKQMNPHTYSFSCFHMYSHDHIKSVVPKVCSADPKGFVTSFQGICRYISVLAALNFDILLEIITNSYL